MSHVEHVALVQHNLKRGLEMFGQAAIHEVAKETQQLHDRRTIRPRNANELTLEEIRRALGYLMFLKDKTGISDVSQRQAMWHHEGQRLC